MKKLLFVVPDRKMGGVSAVLEDILNNLPSDKYQIDLFILNNEGDMFEDRINKNISIIYGSDFFKAVDISLSYFKKHFNLKLFFSKLQLIFLLKTGIINKKLKKERKILNKNYDVEIAFKDGFTALITAAGNTPKKIHWLHSNYGETDPTRRYRQIFKKTYTSFDKIIAVSNETAKGFISHYGLANKIIVLKNMIDDKKIKKLGKIPKLLSNKSINFISVGRLSKIKGYDRLLKVISRLKDEQIFNDACLTIVGDGEEKENLLRLKDFSNLNEVNFVGSQKNPYQYMANADIYISSSLEESFGLTMVEALILGVPVLATETSATSVIIDNEINGFITENSEEGLYQGMKKILENKKFFQKLKNNASKYDYSKIKEEIIQEVENIFDS